LKSKPAKSNPAQSKPAKAPKVPKATRPPTPFELWTADPAKAMAELADCIGAGRQSLNQFVLERGLSYNSVLQWIGRDPEREATYARAREVRAHAFADAIVAISEESEVVARYQGERIVLGLDSAAIARNRLRVDSLKWLASKMMPRVYGEKLDVEAKVALTLEDQLKAIAAKTVPAHAPLPNV
jgi:hypothetical protein